MTEDEDRLRQLLRVSLGDPAPVRFEPADLPSRARRTATITTVVVIVAVIAATVAVFRSSGDRPRTVAGRRPASASVPPMRTQHASPVALTRGIPCTGDASRAGPGELRGFRPVVALRCADVVRGGRDWRTRAIFAGSLRNLVGGLERTDVAATRSGVCADYFDLQPQLVLVDASGRYLRPRFPRDGCGHLHGTPAYRAYLAIDWHEVSATRATSHVLR